MSSSNLHSSVHPEELLAAYALYALDHGETVHVEAHLDDCPQCSRSVAEFQRTAGLLARVVGYRQPDSAVRSRLMDAIAQAGVPAAPAGGLPPLPHPPAGCRPCPTPSPR